MNSKPTDTNLTPNFSKPRFELNPVTPLSDRFSYSRQQAWQLLQCFLPSAYQLNEQTQPQECFWPWRSHQIHIDHYPRPSAAAKIILVHGVGTNGRQMSLILGHPLAEAGYETIALDFPGYGLSQNPDHKAIVYDDWVAVLSDFIAHEQSKDERPIFLFGLSAGGMLCLHSVLQQAQVKGIIGLSFLDQRYISVKKGCMRFSQLSALGLPLLQLCAQTPLKYLRLPMRLVSKMYALSNDPKALQCMLQDRSSAGNAMSLQFLHSYLNYVPQADLAQLQIPVLMAQPELDRWTPLALSLPALQQLSQPYDLVILPQGGHYPTEEAALDELKHSSLSFIEKHLCTQPSI